MLSGESELFLSDNELVVVKDGGNLPHWHQSGRIQYVTFRLADSLPSTKIEELKDYIERFKKRNPEPWELKTKLEYRKRVSRFQEKLLDNNFGSCVLSDPNVRALLARTLHFKDGVDYHLLAYVIMPNHVHLLIRTLNDKLLEEILRSIKSFSAKAINQYLGRTGQLWMRESYDRIVRSHDELKRHRNYIRNNPHYLSPDKYTLYFMPQ